MPLPTGTVTFLFTDIESSTQRWDRHHEAMRSAVERHDEIMRRVIEANRGYVFKTVGDAFCATFGRPTYALTAAIDAQRESVKEDFAVVEGLRVRSGARSVASSEIWPALRLSLRNRRSSLQPIL